MTVYFYPSGEITPAALAWGRTEYALRQAEGALVRTDAELRAFKKQCGIRRRRAGFARSFARRVLAEVEAERRDGR